MALPEVDFFHVVLELDFTGQNPVTEVAELEQAVCQVLHHEILADGIEQDERAQEDGVEQIPILRRHHVVNGEKREFSPNHVVEQIVVSDKGHQIAVSLGVGGVSLPDLRVLEKPCACFRVIGRVNLAPVSLYQKRQKPDVSEHKRLDQGIHERGLLFQRGSQRLQGIYLRLTQPDDACGHGTELSLGHLVKETLVLEVGAIPPEEGLKLPRADKNLVHEGGLDVNGLGRFQGLKCREFGHHELKKRRGMAIEQIEILVKVLRLENDRKELIDQRRS